MSTYRVHYIQHVPYEGLGYIEKWVKDNGYNLTVTRIYEDYKFPDQDDFDMLVIMGGPMGTYEEDSYPWLKDEKLFVRKAIDSGKAVLGICLGSQIIANALGAAVYLSLIHIYFRPDILHTVLFHSIRQDYCLSEVVFYLINGQIYHPVLYS